MPDFIIRDATADDKTEVLEFTHNTWEHGDYIQWVYDDWLADESGRFFVAEDRASGSVAAIDKLTMRRPGEAWFEGLRVNPQFRGQGLSGKLQTHMIGEAKTLGARVIRFLTLVNNTPVHRIAYRDGFSMRFVTRNWDLSLAEPTRSESHALRIAAPAEAPLLFDWWRRGPSFQATGGLLEQDWSYWTSDQEEWVSLAEHGVLFVLESGPVTELVLPPSIAILAEDVDEREEKVWRLRLLSTPGTGWGELASAFAATARASGVTRIRGLLPDTALIHSGLSSAGFVPDPDEDCLVLFTLELGK